MSLFDPPKKPDLPTVVLKQIDDSVLRFENKFRGFSLHGLASANGWFNEYRAELVAIAEFARSTGKDEVIREP